MPCNIGVPAYLDEKFRDSEELATDITPEWIAEQVKESIKVFLDKVGEEYISFAIRAKDQHGNWRIGFTTVAWDRLQDGDTIEIMGKVFTVQDLK